MSNVPSPAPLNSSTSLDDVFASGELNRRPTRPPDYQAESRALSTLMEAMADAPETVLRKLADTARAFCRADSAAIALWETDQPPGLFRWHAVVGELAAKAGETLPGDLIPGRVVMQRDATLLFIDPQRNFLYGDAIESPIAEALVTPFRSDGKPVGAVWLISHSHERRFDLEDQRLLESLTRCASAAWRIASKSRFQQALDTRNAAETLALTRLNQASSRLWNVQNLREGLVEMLTATIELLGADMGNIQLFDSRREVLTIEAHQGFQQAFLDFFREVSARDDSACGRALRSGQRVVIEDVETDAEYAPLLAVARAAGYRAVQSTPIIARNGQPLGIISTHFREPHRLGEHESHMLDLYVRQAADFIEHSHIDEALKNSEEEFQALAEASSNVVYRMSPDWKEMRRLVGRDFIADTHEPSRTWLQ